MPNLRTGERCGDCRILSSGIVLCHSSQNGVERGKQHSDRPFVFCGRSDEAQGFGKWKPLSLCEERTHKAPRQLPPDQRFAYSFWDGTPVPTTRYRKNLPGGGKRCGWCKGGLQGRPQIDVAPYRWHKATKSLEAGDMLFVLRGEVKADLLADRGFRSISLLNQSDERLVIELRRLAGAGVIPVLVPDNDQADLHKWYAHIVAAVPEARSLLCPLGGMDWRNPPRDGGLGIEDWIARSQPDNAAIVAAITEKPWSQGALQKAPLKDDQEDASGSTYREMVAETLKAVLADDEDTQMAIRARIISEYRRSDSQITAAMFELLTEQETGVRRSADSWKGSVDLSAVEGLDALVDGAIPANDIALAYGAKGAGKTAAALALSFAVIDGTGFLDHSKPTNTGSVLFIASDSGTAPLVSEMQRMGLSDHLAVREGPGKRFHVWAHDANQGRKAWGASITGCVHLLQFIKDNAIDLVVIDSAKAVCSKGGVNYLDNDAVTALLTFIKETVCPFASVLLLSHDGTEKGSHSGAKAWAEIPSIVHNIQQQQDKPDERLWRVVKNRMGPLRQFSYRIGEGGQLEPVEGVETIQDAGSAVLQVLQEASDRGLSSISRGDLVTEITRRFRYAPKTIDNTLTRMVGARKPDICRVSRPRGHYKLSPRFLALSFTGTGIPTERKEQGKNTVIERSLMTSPGVETGNSDGARSVLSASNFLRGGNSTEPSQGEGSDRVPSRGWEIQGVELVEGSPSPSFGAHGPATPPSWWPYVEAMLKWEDLDPIQQIPNRLFIDHGIEVDGREVKQAIKAFWVADPDVGELVF